MVGYRYNIVAAMHTLVGDGVSTSRFVMVRWLYHPALVIPSIVEGSRAEMLYMREEQAPPLPR